MVECIPWVTVSTRNNFPWVSKAFMNAMRRRDTLFKKAGYSPNFKSACIIVKNKLHKAKTLYFKILTQRIQGN